MKKKIKNNWQYILVYLIIILMLFLHHKYVCMYYDDFGNASLSYSSTIEGVIGTNFNFSQLLESAIYTYNNFGGRVLYGMFASLLLKNGIKAFMMMQIIIITGILLFIHLIIKHIIKRNTILIPICCMILYCLFDISMLRHGIYWASASILYVWPLLPLFAFIYYYITTIDKIKDKKKPNYLVYILLNILLIFFAIFSQEQIGVGLISFLCIYIFFDHIKEEKKYLKFDLLSLIVTIATYLGLFLAPGNWKRLSGNEEFASLSFFNKIKTNIPKMFDLFFKTKTSIFINILLVLLMIYLVNYIIKKSKKNKKNYYLGILVLGMSVGLIIYDRQWYSNLIFLTIVGAPVLISAFITLIIYYKENKNLKLLAYPISAVCTVFCLLMAPYVVERSTIPCIFIMFIIIISIGLELPKKNTTVKTLIILLFIICLYYGASNYRDVYKGYKANYKTNMENYNKMESNKKEKGKIKLCKVKESIYGSSQPYEEDYDYWLKQYFDIPYEVKFEWRDCNG